MKLKDFDYHLPDSLIAQTPVEPRDYSRLLVMDKNSWEIEDKHFYDILDYLSDNDVLVINKTSVINARMYGEIDIFPKWKKTVKKVEIFLHRQINDNTWECLWYPGKNLKVWRIIRFYDENEKVVMTWDIKKISEMWRYIEFSKWWLEFLEITEKLWEMPLPPYITEKLEDNSRYQTVYWTKKWSAAAPTAGLHFTPELLKKIEEKWVKIEKILLHVGVWTFKPVEVENVKEHYMHKEYIEIEEGVANRLNEYKQKGKRIIAVWTTSVRTLESFSVEKNIIKSGKKDTDIFIYPGYEFKFVDSLITNFHLPCSTLLMLVSALASKEFMDKAYLHAVENKYRFFSFWDAMFIK